MNGKVVFGVSAKEKERTSDALSKLEQQLKALPDSWGGSNIAIAYDDDKAYATCWAQPRTLE
jgi:uncharacterized protein YukE